MRYIKLLFCVIVISLLLGAVALASDLPYSPYKITVNVQKEMPDGSLVPAEGVNVDLHPSGFRWMDTQAATTNAQGKAVFTHYLKKTYSSGGMTIAESVPLEEGAYSVSLPNNYYNTPSIYDDYIWDEYYYFATINLNNKDAEFNYTLRLKKGNNLGGIRLQKLFSTSYHDYEQYKYSMTQMEHEGAHVTGAKFIFYTEVWDNTTSTPLNKYLTSNKTLSRNRADAAEYTTDKNGRILIEEVPVFDTETNSQIYLYNAKEIYTPQGTESSTDTLGYGMGTNVDANHYGTIIYTNRSSEKYNIIAHNVDADTGLQVTGGEFVIYKLREDGTPLYYRTPVNTFETDAYMFRIVTDYSPDINRATVLRNDDIYEYNNFLNSEGKKFTFFEAFDLGMNETHYIKEIKTAPGYAPQTKPIPITKANEYDRFKPEESKIVKIRSTRLENSNLVLKKSEDTFRQYDDSDYYKRIPGTEFMAISVTDANGNNLSLAEYKNIAKKDALKVELLTKDGDATNKASYGTAISHKEFYNSLNTMGTNSPYLKNALVKVTDENGAIVYNNLKDTCHFVIETKASKGFVERHTIQGFDGNKKGSLTIENKSVDNTIFINALDLTGKYLEGVQFTIMGYIRDTNERVYIKTELDRPATSDDFNTMFTTHSNEAKLFVTDKSGMVTVANLLEKRDNSNIAYYVTLTKAPPLHSLVESTSTTSTINTKVAYHKFVFSKYHEYPITLFANKKFEGQTLKGGEFTFELWVDNYVHSTATNDANGLVEFDRLWADADIKKVVIKERKGTDSSIVYDTYEQVYTPTLAKPKSFTPVAQSTSPQDKTAVSRDYAVSYIGGAAIALMFLGEIIFDNPGLAYEIPNFINKLAPNPSPTIAPTPVPVITPPQTGDSFNLWLYVGFSIVAMLVTYAVIRKKK